MKADLPGVPTRTTGPLSPREAVLLRAVLRHRLRLATGRTGLAVIALTTFTGIGLAAFFPEQAVAVAAINGTLAALGLVVAVLGLGRSGLPPLLLASLLALATVVAVGLWPVVLPGWEVLALMTLAMLPPAFALFLPWGAWGQAAWLVGSVAILLIIRGLAVEPDLLLQHQLGAGLILAVSGLASIAGSQGGTEARRRGFEARLLARRAHARTMVRERDLARLNAELARSTRTDPLTGLANRLRMNEALDQAAARLRRSGESCGVALLDLDNFKAYNDVLGHVAGDAALRRVATVLSHTAREVDTVCRFGGEEFLVIMPNETLDGAAAGAERLRAAIETVGLRAPAGTTVRLLTLSAGIAVLGPGGSTEADAVVQAADAALYRAKVRGRNRVMVDCGSADDAASPPGSDPSDLAGAAHRPGPAAHRPARAI